MFGLEHVDDESVGKNKEGIAQVPVYSSSKLYSHRRKYPLSLRLLRLALRTAPCSINVRRMMMPRLPSTVRSINPILRNTRHLVSVPNLHLQSNIIIRKLAHLIIVHPDDLSLLGLDAHAEAGDEVHDPEDDGGHDEGVGKTGGGVGELVSELDVVVVEPTAGNYGDAIEAGDGGLGK